jgi:iron complex outermembrane recepter protein
MNVKRSLFATSALLAAALAASAHAQTADQAADDNQIEELVVTAERREQSLQDVPVAISAFTSEKRDLIGITSVFDMTNFTPGLQYSSQLDRVSLRGVGRTTNVHAADPSVSVYSDGIYTTSTVEAGKTPLFLDRVEVLRGPQATLYGRNAIAGAINLISKRPTEDMYAEVRATYANYDRHLIEGAVSGPTAIPGVLFRLAANWEKQTKGWYDNVVPGFPDEGNVIDTNIVEGQLKFDFNESFEGWAKLTWIQWRNGGGGPGSRGTWTPAPFATYQVPNGATTVDPGYGCSGRVTGVVNPSPLGCQNPAVDDPRKIASVIPYQVKLDGTWIFASEWIWHAPSFDVKYTTGGARYHYTLNRPPDDNVAPVQRLTLPGPAGGLTLFPQQIYNYQEREEWWSHELTFTSTVDGPLQWLAGLYYWNEHYEQPTATYLLLQPQLAAPVGASCPRFGNVCPPNPLLQRTYDEPRFHIQSKAVYAQIDYNFSDAWKLTVGGRYSLDEKSGVERARVLCFAFFACTPGLTPEQLGPFTPAVDLTQTLFVPGATRPRGVSEDFTFDPATGLAQRKYDADWDAVTGNVTLQWEPDSDTTAYVRYSRGYKAGGFRIGVDTALTANPYTKAEYLDDVELGLKKNFGRTLQTNIALFNYDYRNAQIPLTVIDTSGGVTQAQSVFYNVPKARSRGVEIETIWQPIDNLQVLFNYSYLDSEIRRAAGVVDPADPAALDPDATPIGSIADCVARQATPSAADNCPADVFTALTGGGFQLGQDLKGQKLPNAPKHKVALNVNYTWELEAASLTASATYTWRDAQFGSIFNRAYTRSPSWDQVDARLTWAPSSDRYTVILFAKNIFDDVGYEGGAGAARRAGFIGPATAGGSTVIPVTQGIATSYPLTPPRTYGIELQYRFF